MTWLFPVAQVVSGLFTMLISGVAVSKPMTVLMSEVRQPHETPSETRRMALAIKVMGSGLFFLGALAVVAAFL